MINHRKSNLNNVLEGLEKEFLVLLNKFSEEDLKNIPNVGFQVIYPIDTKGIDVKKISETICALVAGTDTLRKESKNNHAVDQNKVDKLLQLRFAFFPDFK